MAPGGSATASCLHASGARAGLEECSHDLHACDRKAKELGLLKLLQEYSNDVDAMRMLVDLNHSHGLRYIRTGAKQFPLWSIVDPLVRRWRDYTKPSSQQWATTGPSRWRLAGMGSVSPLPSTAEARRSLAKCLGLRVGSPLGTPHRRPLCPG